MKPLRSRAPSLYCFCQQAWQISERWKSAFSSNSRVWNTSRSAKALPHAVQAWARDWMFHSVIAWLPLPHAVKAPRPGGSGIGQDAERAVAGAGGHRGPARRGGDIIRREMIGGVMQQVEPAPLPQVGRVLASIADHTPCGRRRQGANQGASRRKGG